MKEKKMIISCRMIEQELHKIMREEQVSYPVVFLPANLHLEPQKLRDYIQGLVDSICNVDEILLTVSNCGGATTGLKATTADLVLPRCEDCIDMLLTGDRFADRSRSRRSMFLTESWLEISEGFEGGYLDAEARYGTDAANHMLEMLYQDYDFYDLIDTGAYDLDVVEQYIALRAQVADMQIRTVPGPCAPLRKLVTGQIDGDFMIVPRGKTVNLSDFMIL